MEDPISQLANSTPPNVSVYLKPVVWAFQIVSTFVDSVVWMTGQESANHSASTPTCGMIPCTPPPPRLEDYFKPVQTPPPPRQSNLMPPSKSYLTPIKGLPIPK